MLKGRASNVERQVEPLARRFDKGNDLGGELLEGFVAADQARARELVLQVAPQLLRIVAEQNGADAFFARGDENQAEPALSYGEAYVLPGAAFTEVGRRHAEDLRGIGVEAAIGIEASVIDCRGHRVARRKPGPHALVAMRDGVGLRRDADRLLEDAMEVIGAQAHDLGERIELRRLFRRLDQPAGLRDLRRMHLAERGLVGLAAFAGAEACPLCLVPRVEEAHIVALGETRRTTGAAINAGGFHRNVELAGEGSVAGRPQRPTLPHRGTRG